MDESLEKKKPAPDRNDAGNNGILNPSWKPSLKMATGDLNQFAGIIFDARVIGNAFQCRVIHFLKLHVRALAA